MDEFDRKHKDDTGKNTGVKKVDPEKASKRFRNMGFSRGLTAEKILGATYDPGELYFLIKVPWILLETHISIPLTVEGF